MEGRRAAVFGSVTVVYESDITQVNCNSSWHPRSRTSDRRKALEDVYRMQDLLGVRDVQDVSRCARCGHDLQARKGRSTV